MGVNDIYSAVQPWMILLGITVLIVYLERRNLAKGWTAITQFISQKKR
jgi:hypothetical protein